MGLCKKDGPSRSAQWYNAFGLSQRPGQNILLLYPSDINDWAPSAIDVWAGDGPRKPKVSAICLADIILGQATFGPSYYPSFGLVAAYRRHDR